MCQLDPQGTQHWVFRDSQPSSYQLTRHPARRAAYLDRPEICCGLLHVLITFTPPPTPVRIPLDLIFLSSLQEMKHRLLLVPSRGGEGKIALIAKTQEQYAPDLEEIKTAYQLVTQAMDILRTCQVVLKPVVNAVPTAKLAQGTPRTVALAQRICSSTTRKSET